MTRPLEGKTVLITRPKNQVSHPKNQVSQMTNRLEELGASVYFIPLIEILPPEDINLVDEALTNWHSFSWVIFTSQNAVDSLEERARVLNIPPETLASVKLATVGTATATRLESWLRYPDAVPDDFVSSAITATLGDLSGQRVLLPRADLASNVLPTNLRDAGAEVTEVIAYRIVKSNDPIILPESTPDYLTLTSAETARTAAEKLESAGKGHWLREMKLACIGPVTSEAVTSMGLTPAFTAKTHTIEGLIEGIVNDAEVLHA